METCFGRPRRSRSVYFRAATWYSRRKANLQRLPLLPADHRRLCPLTACGPASESAISPGEAATRKAAAGQRSRGPGTNHGCLANGSFCLKNTQRGAYFAPSCPSTEVTLGPCLPAGKEAALGGGTQHWPRSQGATPLQGPSTATDAKSWKASVGAQALPSAAQASLLPAR